jgi:hypothetical protein
MKRREKVKGGGMEGRMKSESIELPDEFKFLTPNSKLIK